MKLNFKKRFWKLARWFGVLFCLLFIFRLIYGYVAKDVAEYVSDYSSDFFSNLSNLRKNYASEKMYTKGGDVQYQANVASNQKYEKTASVKIKSAEFGADQKQIKEKTKKYNAIVQYEQNIGQKGNREIHLLIGVDPLLFDSFYIDIQKIGVIKATEITKVDKTNEYRQLNARKVSLEKTLKSLNELKSKGGQVADFVSLHDKILEIETVLQELGVELGNFDTENEFCTIKLSLYEGATEKGVSLIHRIKVALEWTIKYFAILICSLLALSCTVFILLLIIDKLKLINSVADKLNQ